MPAYGAKLLTKVTIGVGDGGQGTHAPKIR